MGGFRAVVVAVIAVPMVQMAVHQVIDVAAVRHRRMAATGAVLVRFLVPLASVLGSAVGRIGRIDGQSATPKSVAADHLSRIHPTIPNKVTRASHSRVHAAF